MSKKKDIEDIKRHALTFGWKCNSNNYKGKDYHLEYECPKGHIRNISWNAFRNGRRCSICSKKRKKTIEEIEEYVCKFGWECLSKKYKNCLSKLKFKCPNKHIVEMSASDFINNNLRCAECSGIKKKTLKEIKFLIKELSNNKIECLSEEYKNNKQQLKLRCVENKHMFRRSWNRFTKNQKCMKCIEDKMLNKLDNMNRYYYIVRLLTERNYRKYKKTINKENVRRGTKYHLDHIYSISSGFHKGILPEIISNPNNLRIIKSYKNLSKKGKCSISEQELYKRFDEFKNEENKIL